MSDSYRLAYLERRVKYLEDRLGLTLDDSEVLEFDPLNVETFYDYLSDNISLQEERLNRIPTHYFFDSDPFGQTLLHWASQKGDLDDVKYIIERTQNGLMKSRTYVDEYTPLHLAVLGNGYEEVAPFLWRLQKDLLNVADKHGRTALYMCAGKGLWKHLQEMCDLMTDDALCAQNHEERFTMLHVSLRAGHEPFSKELCSNTRALKKVAHIKDKYGQTALHWAANAGYYDVCESLCKIMGAELINAQSNESKCTALHFAVNKNHVNVVVLLLKYGTDAKIRDVCGKTPLDWALDKGYNVLCDAMKIEDVVQK